MYEGYPEQDLADAEFLSCVGVVLCGAEFL